jgi:spore maturation protein CgeB
LQIVHLNPDDPFGHYGDTIWKTFIAAIPEYDVHFVPKERNRKEYAELGAKRVYVYDRSFDPANHRPWSLSAEEMEKWGCKIGFIGSYAPHRESILAAIAEAGLPLVIWGNGWARGMHWGRLKAHWRGGAQFGEDYAKAISGMDIALHFLRHENRDLQDSRSFEIPACKTFMLAERSSDHLRLYKAGEEADFFDSPEECIAKCRYYLDNALKRQQIARNGYRRIFHSGYDYKSRVEEMLQAITSKDSEKKSWRGIS